MNPLVMKKMFFNCISITGRFLPDNLSRASRLKDRHQSGKLFAGILTLKKVMVHPIPGERSMVA